MKNKNNASLRAITVLLVPLLAMGALCLTPQRTQAESLRAVFPRNFQQLTNVFTRMFPLLPPFAQQTDAARASLRAVGSKGGLLDANDHLFGAPTDPNAVSFNPEHPDMPAGMTFLGQFLDHDITFDKRSSLNANTDPAATINFRSAAFDLDSLYGNGPDASPELYDFSARRVRFLVQPIAGSGSMSRKGVIRFDVPRDRNNVAIIGDSRNDENLVISQLHVAMLRFHNAVTDLLAATPYYFNATPQQIFQAARLAVTRHYQWIILHEYLPAIIGQPRLNGILLNGARFYRHDDGRHSVILPGGRVMPLIPIEFSAAAYRFGHSQVRPFYQLNAGTSGFNGFSAVVFNDTLNAASPDPEDMRGGVRAPRRFVDWQHFFDFGDGTMQRNKQIDTKLSSPLLSLLSSPATAPGLPIDDVLSLPSRTLMRHINFGLPSGQMVAMTMNAPVLGPQQFAELAPFALDARTTLDRATPLWYYILKEAEVLEKGRRLGPVGGTIVGEVFVSLMRADRDSVLNAGPAWRPWLPAAVPGTFRMTDLLRFAGVVVP